MARVGYEARRGGFNARGGLIAKSWEETAPATQEITIQAARAVLAALLAAPPPALVRAVLEQVRQYWKVITDDWQHHNVVVVRRARSVILGIDSRLAELAREERDGPSK